MDVKYPIPIDVFHLSLARDILHIWPESHHLQELINTIESELKKNSDKAIDAAKCLVEAVCKTILNERGIEYGKALDVQEIVKLTLKHFGIEANSTNQSIRDIATGFERSVNGISNIRNDYGPLSHGRDAYHQKIRDTVRHSIVRSVEMIAVQLIEFHVSQEPNWKYTRKPYDESSTINLLIDDHSEIEAVAEKMNCYVNGVSFRPSQILYDLDRDAYIEALTQIDETNLVSEEMLKFLKEKYPDWVKSNIISIRFIHLSSGVHLYVLSTQPDGSTKMDLESTDFIGGPHDDLLFSPAFPAQVNAKEFLDNFDPYSIINCFNIFTEEACKQIADDHEKNK